MISIKFNVPEEVQGDDCECDSCELYVGTWEALPISNPLKQLFAGDVIPVGECPHCDLGLVYLIEEDEDEI